MSEDKKLNTVVTYDQTKSITGIEVSAAYIEAFQRILSEMILDAEDPSLLPATFEKFNKIAELKEGDEPPQFEINLYESNLYTLFSLLQLLKFKAKEQGLEIHTETTATKKDMEELSNLVTKGADVSEKLKEINSKMKVVK
jgi:hypothetical protein